MLPSPPAGTGTLVPYKVHITTGDKRGAGTSADVHCILTGDKATSGIVKLAGKSSSFDRGRTDIFTVECKELGKLSSITLGHDNSVRRNEILSRAFPAPLFRCLCNDLLVLTLVVLCGVG